MDSSGDGIASPGDTCDIIGALTGRDDFLSGVGVVPGVKEGKKKQNVILKP